MHGEPESSASISDQLATAAKGSPYRLEAFILVWEVVSHITRSATGPRHVNAEQVCWSLLEYSVRLYGKQASRQLGDWGITTCGDIGRIVQALIDADLVEAAEKDSLEHFEMLPDFQGELARCASPILHGMRQWKLSTLFVLTAIVAVGFAGFSRLGFAGAVQTLLGSWLTLIGGFWLMNLRKETSPGYMFAFMWISAFIFITIGVWIFLVTILSTSW